MSIQATIEASAAALPPSLARVADAVRRDPALVVDMTITELADACDTSIASVVRFCRAIGFDGYAALRRSLAAELGKESARFSANGISEIDEADSLPDAIAKIAALEVLAIEETMAQLDMDALSAAVDAIDCAERILLFGIGASRFVAEDLAHKLRRVGRNAQLLADPHEAVAATVLHAGDTVAIAFSNSGSTVESIRFLQSARRGGAATIAVTGSADSPISEAADRTLRTQARESTFRAGAMVSRIAQLALVDALFIGAAQRRHAETVEALRATREAIRELQG